MRFALLLLALPCSAASLDHSPWDRLLERYVTAESRVDYARWKADGAAELDRYVATLAAAWPTDLFPADRKAASINAYNALVVRWILANFPAQSIWKTKKPFTEARHTVDGKKVSLDQVENGLRDLGDPTVHAVLVCAARSCPPLRREAYRGDRLEAQMDSNAANWLANEQLNQFDRERNRANVSSIFKWFADDFRAAGLPAFLKRHGPPGVADWLTAETKIDHLKYDWGLNDTGRVGDNYGGPGLWWDVLKNKF